MREAKILKKDLPFSGLKAGIVISKFNSDFIINHGEHWYDGKIGGGSHNGHTVFDKTTTDFLEIIWNNNDWFEKVKITPIKWSRNNKSVTLSFEKPLDLYDIERFAKGLYKTLNDHYKNTVKKMGWTDELVDVIF